MLLCCAKVSISAREKVFDVRYHFISLISVFANLDRMSLPTNLRVMAKIIVVYEPFIKQQRQLSYKYFEGRGGGDLALGCAFR